MILERELTTCIMSIVIAETTSRRYIGKKQKIRDFVFIYIFRLISMFSKSLKNFTNLITIVV